MAPRRWMLAGILLLVLSLLFRVPQDGLRRILARRPRLLFAVPALLVVLFTALASWAGAFSLALTALVTVYLFVPAGLAFAQGPGPARPSCRDFAIILLLWLPIEFGAGAALIPARERGFLHSAAYGIGILMALVLFLVFRAWDGMKYRVPASGRDFLYALLGFAASAPVLILAGRALNFIPPWHAPARIPPAAMPARFLTILVGTGFPEEILFRSLIQNGLMQRYGATTAILLLASAIFGCAHLNNGPLPLPNWRYMILASIAGFAYGKVFQKSSSVWGPATLHAMVDWTKHVFF
jgi:membrane protease YdiL (CAAX protease family)